MLGVPVLALALAALAALAALSALPASAEPRSVTTIGWDAAAFERVAVRASWYRCRQTDTWAERQCEFRDVCFDQAIGRFVYYLPPAELMTEYTQADHDGAKRKPLDTLDVTLRAFRTGLTIDTLRPVVRRSEIPSDAVVFPLPVVVHTAALQPENFGHAIGDDIMPVYQLLLRFGLFRPDVLALYTQNRTCEDVTFDQQTRLRGCPRLAKLFSYLTTTPIAAVGVSPPFVKVSPATQGASAPRVVCVQHLLAGSMRSGMRATHVPSEWDGLIEHIVQGAAPDEAAARPLSQRIILVDKDGRRRITNLDPLANYLRAVFQIPVDIVSTLPQMPLPAQVARLRTYSVMVSPCGGISFAAAFMAPGSSAVFTGFWDPVANSTRQMEQHIWNKGLALRDFYYPTHGSDVTVRVPELGGPERNWYDKINLSQRYRDYGDVTVSLPHMARVVYDALYSAERAFGWNDSFSRARLYELPTSAARR